MSSSSFSSAHIELYRYWAARCGTRTMPARADLDPVAMKPYLPHLMLFDVVGERFRYRLVGTRVVQDFGRDVTGSYLGEGNPQQPFAADVTGIFVRVRDRGTPLFTVGHHQTPAGVAHSVSRLLLPLGQEGRVGMILLCRLARYPRRQDETAGWDVSAQSAQSEVHGVASEIELAGLVSRWEAHSDNAGTAPDAASPLLR